MAEVIKGSDSIQDVLMKMSEGNPGGLTIMMNMLKDYPDEGFMNILHLDSMGIRGGLIWCAYKDVYGEDLKKFMEMIPKRDQFRKDLNACESYTSERNYLAKHARA